MVAARFETKLRVLLAPDGKAPIARKTMRKMYSACAIAAILAGGVAIGVMISSRNTVRLIEPSVHLVEPFIESEVVRATATIENVGTSPAVVESVVASCACTSILTPEGTPLEAGYAIGPQCTARFTVEVTTVSRPGDRQEVVVFRVASAAGTYMLKYSANFTVLPRWRLEPAHLLMDASEEGVAVTRTVKVYAAQSLRKVGIAEVKSSWECLEAILEPAEAAGGDPHVGDIVVTYRPPAEPGERAVTLTLVPDGDGQEPTNFLARCRDVYVPIVAFPSELFISVTGDGADSPQVRRIVRCVLRQEANATPSVEAVGAGVGAMFREPRSQDEWLIEVTIDPRSVDTSALNRISIRAGRNELSVPVYVTRD